MDPRSQRLGGLLTTTDGLEQKADINPGRQTPGQRFGTETVVVEGAEVVVAFGLAVVGRAVVDVTTDGLELPADGRDPEVGAVTLFVFCSLAPPPPSRRLMQHLPPLAQTALASIKSQRYEKNPVTQVPYKKKKKRKFNSNSNQLISHFIYFASFVIVSCWNCRGGSLRPGTRSCCCGTNLFEQNII